MKPTRVLLSCLAVALSAGCGAVFHSSVPAPLVYQLRAGAAPAAAGVVAATLVVARPRARPGLDGDHIVVTLPGQRLDAYAGARWSGPLPLVVQSLLVDGLRGSGGWQAVVADHSAFGGRYLLQTEIGEFGADYAVAGAPPVARVTLHAELGRSDERRVLAEVEGSAVVPARADRQGEVTAALEAAYAEAAARLIGAVNAAALAAERPAAAP